MANIKSAKKEIRKSKKRREQNSNERSRLRTFDKKIRQLLSEKKLEEAGKEYKVFSSYLDRAGKKNLSHPKQADRRKSRMAHLLNSVSSGQGAAQ